MEKRYRALRAIATVFKVLGWAILILGILSACGASASMVFMPDLILGPGQRGGSEATLTWIIVAVVSFIAMIVSVGLYALILIAAAEAIHVFLDIEENTREMVRRFGQMGGSAGPSSPIP